MTTSRSDKALVFVVGAASLVDLATDTPWREGHWIGPFFQLTPATQLTSAVCAALLALLALVLLRGGSPAPPVRDEARERLVELLPAVSMVYAFVWARVFVPHAFALPWNVVAVAAPLFVCASAFKRWPLRHVTGVVLVVGVMLRLVLFARFSIDEGADMLPLTRAALANLVKGASPYT